MVSWKTVEGAIIHFAELSCKGIWRVGGSLAVMDSFFVFAT